MPAPTDHEFGLDVTRDNEAHVFNSCGGGPGRCPGDEVRGGHSSGWPSRIILSGW